VKNVEEIPGTCPVDPCNILQQRQSSVAKPFSEILIIGDDRSDEFSTQKVNCVDS
jgi:hypothetical protein